MSRSKDTEAFDAFISGCLERLGDRIAGEIGALRSQAERDSTSSRFVNVVSGLPTLREHYAGLFHAALLGRTDNPFSNPQALAELALRHASALVQHLRHNPE